jgi:hypothetical protein
MGPGNARLDAPLLGLAVQNGYVRGDKSPGKVRGKMQNEIERTLPETVHFAQRQTGQHSSAQGENDDKARTEE